MTKHKSATNSANASAMIPGVNALLAASGFLEIELTRAVPIRPIPIAAATNPREKKAYHSMRKGKRIKEFLKSDCNIKKKESKTFLVHIRKIFFLLFSTTNWCCPSRDGVTQDDKVLPKLFDH